MDPARRPLQRAGLHPGNRKCNFSEQFRDGSTASLTKLSQLKVALEADLKYAQVITGLITYTAVAVEDLSSDIFFGSLKVELATTQMRIKDVVQF